MKNNSLFSYLEFGSVEPDSGKRHVYDFRSHDQAYDWLMHARYSSDIVAYHDMLDALASGNLEQVASFYVNRIHHADDFVFNVNKWLALNLTHPSFRELGQTLFGCIDGMLLVENLLQPCLSLTTPAVLQEVSWQGIDISEFFNRMASLMHSHYKVKTSTTLEKFPETCGVFFAKGITLLYAIRSVEQLINLAEQSEIAIFDYSFRLDNALATQIGTGLDVHYLSQNEFLDAYRRIKQAGREIWVRGNARIEEKNRTFYLEGFIAEPARAEAYLELQTQWPSLFRQYYPELSQALIHNHEPDYWHWFPLAEILSQYGLTGSKKG